MTNLFSSKLYSHSKEEEGGKLLFTLICPSSWARACAKQSKGSSRLIGYLIKMIKKVQKSRTLDTATYNPKLSPYPLGLDLLNSKKLSKQEFWSRLKPIHVLGLDLSITKIFNGIHFFLFMTIKIERHNRGPFIALQLPRFISVGRGGGRNPKLYLIVL